MARCAECGTEIDPGEARCPACQAPRVGEPRRAPGGSEPPPPETGTRSRGWNTAVWIGMLAVVAVGVLIALL